MTPMALLEHYTSTIIAPDWSIQHELVEENIASLTWKFRDDADNPRQGILLILTTQPDQRLMRLWVAGVPVGEQERSLGRESPPRKAR